MDAARQFREVSAPISLRHTVEIDNRLTIRVGPLTPPFNTFHCGEGHAQTSLQVTGNPNSEFRFGNTLQR